MLENAKLEKTEMRHFWLILKHCLLVESCDRSDFAQCGGHFGSQKEEGSVA